MMSLGHFFETTVQKSELNTGAVNDFTVEFCHHTKSPVSGRMRWTNVQGNKSFVAVIFVVGIVVKVNGQYIRAMLLEIRRIIFAKRMSLKVMVCENLAKIR